MASTPANPIAPLAPAGTAPSGTLTTGNTAATNTAATTTTTGTGNTTSTGNTTLMIHSSHSASGPGSITILERQIHDSSWPSDLVLDLTKTNWLEWSRCLTLLADRLYVSRYLDGTLSCPDVTAHPVAHQIWTGNDKSLHAFMLERIAPEEYDMASPLGSAHATFDGLRTRHEKLGLHAQINILHKALDVCYKPGTPMQDTSKELRNLHDCITKMGKIDDDKLLTVLIINSLGRYYSTLQSSIHGMTDDANFSAQVAFKRIDTEASLKECRAELGIQSLAVALNTSGNKEKGVEVVCSNCKCLHHTIKFCVRPGSGMAGRTTDKAKAAQRAAAGKPPRLTTGKVTNTANIASTPITIPVATPSTPLSAVLVNINGVSYILTPTLAPITATTTTSHNSNFCNHSGTVLEMEDLVDFEAYLIENGSLRASLNWDKHSKTVDLSNTQAHAASC
ncbi:hypothetical protein DFH94DRAFT_699574 [Russula ochroleuca]|jgi:hypothetical protein|uniref:Uncharacterized protein n=1 Tax=Russula ochroleuca TaxID=152965 RepID=A0A9P5JUG8_9AGAM|nr:hypothetical protein DFH94DRAFT_699574 [Russula ochroleuca]